MADTHTRQAIRRGTFTSVPDLDLAEWIRVPQVMRPVATSSAAS